MKKYNNNNNNNKNNNNNNNNNKNNNNNFPMVLKYQVVVRQGISRPQGHIRIFIGLVGNFPRDGILIKILVVVQL